MTMLVPPAVARRREERERKSGGRPSVPQPLRHQFLRAGGSSRGLYLRTLVLSITCHPLRSQLLTVARPERTFRPAANASIPRARRVAPAYALREGHALRFGAAGSAHSAPYQNAS